MEWSSKFDLIIIFFCMYHVTNFAFKQMKRKVSKLTAVALDEGDGDEDTTAQLIANFMSQRVVSPFVRLPTKTPRDNFAANAITTLKEARKVALKPGCPADMYRRAVISAGAHGPMSPNPVRKQLLGPCWLYINMFYSNFKMYVEQLSLRQLARVAGYGSNHMRAKSLFDAKQNANDMDELLADDAVAGIFKERKDKLTGHPIWQEAWHHFMELKKGQSFRCKIVKTERVKDCEGKWVWKTQWARHQKRFMSMTIAQFRENLIKWAPYLAWREEYMSMNPRLEPTWHVGISRLYKERCFCIDEQEDIRKMGCEYHLKMQGLVAGLKQWRRTVRAKIMIEDPSHTCSVSTFIMFCNNCYNCFALQTQFRSHIYTTFVLLSGLQC